MSDGLFDQGRSEQFRQANITRERFLVVATNEDGDTYEGAASSSFASVDPGDTGAGTSEGLGPHFVMSGRTSDGSPHSYGFSVAFITDGLENAGPVATYPEGEGFNITVWVLVASLQIENLPNDLRQQWISLGTAEGVFERERWHTFDVNACAVRFQIGNVEQHGLIGIIFSEL